MQPFLPEPQHGNITVNPVIKIVNGDDKSSGSIDSGTASGLDTPTVNRENSGISGVGRNIGNIGKPIVEEPDFSKPMIVMKKQE